jgi:N-carbamoylputrescine amidase
MTQITVSVLQQKISTSKESNLAASIKGIADAKAKGADLVLLQELHTSPYFCQTADPAFFSLAEIIPGPSTEKLSQAAIDHQIVIVASLFENRGQGIYHNTAIVIESDGSIAGLYRKMHIPDDPGYYEKYYFTPGDLGFTPIKTSVGTLGVLICWDQWFPEAARLMTLAGADLLLYPTAIGFAPEDTEDEKKRQLDAWITVQRGHAIANTIPVITCNRTGFEADPSANTQGIDFWGSSFIAGYQGELVAQASIKNEEMLTSTIDLNQRKQVQTAWPYLRDRRIDAYHDLLKRSLK